MATRTIADAGGAWATDATWVEGTAPTAADEVVATATSGNLTIAANAVCRSIDLTGYTGTLTHNASCALTIGDATAPTGNNALVFPASGWTYTLGSATTSSISFASTSATALNINPGGKTFGSTTFNGTNGSWKLTGHILLGATATITVTIAIFDANGFNVTCGLFVSSSSSVRTITMGSGTWTLTGNAGTIWNTAVTTNLTFTPGSAAVVCNYSGSTGTRTISSGAPVEAAAVDFTVTAGTDIFTFGASTGRCRNLTFDGFAGTWGASITLTVFGSVGITSNSSAMTVATGSSTIVFSATSGTKTLTTAGKTLNSITVNGVGGTLQLADHLTIDPVRTLTLTNGTLDFNNKNVSVGAFSSSNSNTRVLTMGSGTLTLSRTTTATIWTTATATGLTVTANTCAVVIVDGASASNRTLNGSPTFYSLTCSATVAQTLTFTDGITVTVSNSVNISGASGQLLTLAGSGVAGWTIAMPATQTLGYLSVSRSTATGNTALAGSTSTDGGNNTNWNFGPPVNTLPPSALPTSGTTGTEFEFDSGTWTGSPNAWLWEDSLVDVDDWTQFSDEENPTRVYGTPGEYRFRLSAGNAGGFSSPVEGSNTITVAAESSGGGVKRMRLGLGLGM